jgi:colanic acid/amylovoran biosynthesis protein
MVKKVVIVPACTDLNRGDQALVWEAAYLLESAIEEQLDISIVDYGNNAQDREKQSRQTKAAGFKVFRNIVENPKRIISESTVHSSKIGILLAGLLAVGDFFRHFLLLCLPYEFLFNLLFPNKEHQETFRVIKNSDSIVVKGGGFLHTYGKIEDLYYLWFGLYYLLLGRRLNKKLIVLPNSIGPITGFSNRLFTRWVLNKCDLLYVRERVSLDFCHKIGIKNAKYAFDLGYYAEESLPTALNKELVDDCISKLSKEKANIGITVRPYRFPSAENPAERYENYINSIATFCNKNKENSAYHFIVQVQGPSAHETDMIAINDVISKLESDVEYTVIDIDINYKEIMSVYDKLDFLIGTRFHSVIFSQVQGVPAVAIAYGGNKTHGIMKEIGLHEYVVDINEISAEALQSIFTNLAQSTSEYQKKLEAAFQAIEVDRQSVLAELRRVLNK